MIASFLDFVLIFCLGAWVFATAMVTSAQARGPVLNHPSVRAMVLDTPEFKITFDRLSEKEALYAASALKLEVDRLTGRLGLPVGGKIHIMLLCHGNFFFETPADTMKNGRVHVLNYGPPYEREAFPPERILLPPVAWAVLMRAMTGNPSAFGRSVSQSMLPMWIIVGAVFLEFGRFSFLPSLNLALAAMSDRMVPYDTMGVSAKFFRGDFRGLAAESGGFLKNLLEYGEGDSMTRETDGRKTFRRLLREFSIHPYGFDGVFGEVYRNSPAGMHEVWARERSGSESPLAGMNVPSSWEKVFDGEGFSPRSLTGGFVITVPSGGRHYVYDLVMVSGKRKVRLDGQVGRRIAKAVAGSDEILYYVKFNEDRDGNLREDIFTISPGNGKSGRVTSGGGFVEPSVSSTGKVLVAVKKRPFASALVRISNTGAVESLTPHVIGRYDFSPAVSPDGGQVAFIRYEGETSDLFLLFLDGRGEPARVTMDRGLEFLPEWIGSDRISVSVLRDGLPVRMTILRRPGSAGREIWRTFEPGVPVLDADFSETSSIVMAFTRDGAGVFRINH